MDFSSCPLLEPNEKESKEPTLSVLFKKENHWHIEATLYPPIQFYKPQIKLPAGIL